MKRNNKSMTSLRNRRSNHSNKFPGPPSTTTILGRIYPWATVDCFNPNHCDFERLIHMLLSSHREMLRIDTVERFYEQYRTDHLLTRRMDEMISLKSKKNQYNLA
ncbi:uncharacterized protein BX664DRAFT_324696 [Halteromyces radiatus]|uniref:uncharacterized protein n=1 Tax=Halteromyces radiatus TaxID=101107 RepID=UPI002220EA9C|nr:uncharacterized protein BX664DRAFT_324696 [Halteromyces radiatus]KAI8096726.1 hypothetical protein BX664DRAFT_324696 [Halteromyces radiatus]